MIIGWLVIAVIGATGVAAGLGWVRFNAVRLRNDQARIPRAVLAFAYATFGLVGGVLGLGFAAMFAKQVGAV